MCMLSTSGWASRMVFLEHSSGKRLPNGAIRDLIKEMRSVTPFPGARCAPCRHTPYLACLDSRLCKSSLICIAHMALSLCTSSAHRLKAIIFLDQAAVSCPCLRVATSVSVRTVREVHAK